MKLAPDKATSLNASCAGIKQRAKDAAHSGLLVPVSFVVIVSFVAPVIILAITEVPCRLDHVVGAGGLALILGDIHPRLTIIVVFNEVVVGSQGQGAKTQNVGFLVECSVLVDITGALQVIDIVVALHAGGFHGI